MSNAVLNHSFYKPARGGHAPGDLRNAFLEAIEAYEAWETGEPEPTVELRERQMCLPEVCGLLWNCSDIMPGLDQRHLENMLPDPEGSCFTYARAARALRAAIAAAV